MNISFVAYTDIPDGGAVAHRVLTLGKGLASLGHEVHIAVPYKFAPGPLCEEIEGVKVHWGAYTTPRAGDALWGRLRRDSCYIKRHADSCGRGWTGWCSTIWGWTACPFYCWPGNMDAGWQPIFAIPAGSPKDRPCESCFICPGINSATCWLPPTCNRVLSLAGIWTIRSTISPRGCRG